MRNNSDAMRLKEVCEDISKVKSLKTHITLLTQLFGKRFEKAQETLSENKVKKYVFQPSSRVSWVVIGKNREYQVIPLANFCNCDDYYFRVIDNQVYVCYHLLAQKLAEALGLFEVIDASDDLYNQFMEKWRVAQIKDTRIPKEELRHIRNFIEEMLRIEPIEIHQLLLKTRETGFDVVTAKQLATVLSTDPKKRFSCKNGVWSLKKQADIHSELEVDR